MYICFLQFSEESQHIRSIVIIIKKDSYVNVQTHQGLSFIVSLFPDVEIDMACSVLNCLCVAFMHQTIETNTDRQYCRKTAVPHYQIVIGKSCSSTID